MTYRLTIRGIRTILAHAHLRESHAQSGLDTRKIDMKTLLHSGGTMPYRMKPAYSEGYRLREFVHRSEDRPRGLAIRIVWQPEDDFVVETTNGRDAHLLFHARAMLESAGVRLVSDRRYPHDIIVPLDQEEPTP